MQRHFWHLLLIQFLMLFHMVLSVLLSMVAFSTTFLLVNTFQQPIRIFEISGYWSYYGRQNAGYHVKEHRKLYQKQVTKVTLHFVWGHILKKQTVGYAMWVALLNQLQLPNVFDMKKNCTALTIRRSTACKVESTSYNMANFKREAKDEPTWGMYLRDLRRSPNEMLGIR